MVQPVRVVQPDVAGWTPSVLTEYEIGRAIWAAEIVAKSDKPVTEVGCRTVTAPEALLDDLRECLKLASEAADVKIWTRSAGGKRLRYGFYRGAWVMGALDFLDRAELPDVDRAWINGLLFGYRSEAIQRSRRRLRRDNESDRSVAKRATKFPSHCIEVAVLALRRFLARLKMLLGIAARLAAVNASPLDRFVRIHEIAHCPASELLAGQVSTHHKRVANMEVNN